MLILAFFLACADPKPAALAVCQALPGLAVDDAGKALLAPVMPSAEVALWDNSAPTLGLEKLGSQGLADLRAATVCELGKVESAGSGRWAVPVTRKTPEVKPDGTTGDPITTELILQVVDGAEGLRVETGLKAALVARGYIDEAAKANDWTRAASLWRAMYKSYPDPLIAVDQADAEAKEFRQDTIKALKIKLTGVQDRNLGVQITNKNKRALAGAHLRVTFEGVPTPVEAEVPAIEKDGVVQLSVPIPEAASAGVVAEITEYTEAP